LRRVRRSELKNIDLSVELYRVQLPFKDVPARSGSAHRRKLRRTLLAGSALAVAAGASGLYLWSAHQTATTPSTRRIAVLPFKSLSTSSDDEYFADGMTEELISRLSRVQGLEVIATASIATYRETTKTITQIATELNANMVLHGTVRKAADRVRISAQQISGETLTSGRCRPSSLFRPRLLSM
jgi:TolB-like protein